MDVFMFIIWNNAYGKKADILNDISSAFHIIKTIEISWKDEAFAANLSRFYGAKLPPGCDKERAVGKGPFTLAVFSDPSPVYEERLTTRGDHERVNIHTFDKKSLYRSWTRPEGGNNCIHGSNTPEETEHDLYLLTGMGAEEFRENAETLPDSVERGIAGAEGFNDREELFGLLNHCCNYVLLEVNDKESILLTDEYPNVVRLCGGFEPAGGNSVYLKGKLGGDGYSLVLRYPGDGFLDEKTEKRLLKQRVFKDGRYVPSDSGEYHRLRAERSLKEKDIKDVFTEKKDPLWLILKRKTRLFLAGRKKKKHLQQTV